VSGKLYQLDLRSLHWSENTISQLRPMGYSSNLSFTPIDDERIVLSGGSRFELEMSMNVWVLNVSTKTWTRYFSGPQSGSHFVAKDPHSSALFVVDGIHGFSKIQLWPEKQPKSLLWHALKAIDQQRGQTGMPGIPVHLQHKFLLPGEKCTELGDKSNDESLKVLFNACTEGLQPVIQIQRTRVIEQRQNITSSTNLLTSDEF
jgi:hypothetical protein